MEIIQSLFIIFIIIFLVIVIKFYRAKKEIWVKNFKKNSLIFNVNLQDIEIKGHKWQEEVFFDKYNRKMDKNSWKVPYDSKYENRYSSKFVVEISHPNEGDLTYSFSLPKDSDVLKIKFYQTETTKLYIDRTDSTMHYLDLEFL